MPFVGPFEIDNKTYVTTHQAVELIGPFISNATLCAWVKRGHTPWDLDLDVKTQPTRRHKPTAARQFETRLVISEASALLLKRLLTQCRQNPNRPMKFTNDELAMLRAASVRLNS